MSGRWQDLDARVDAYLDGTMAPAEVRAFEADLIDPDVSAALSEALLLRELLAGEAFGDESLPEGLVARIEEALGVEEGARPVAKGRRLGRLRAFVRGASWGVRGPAIAAAPAGESLGATRSWWRLMRGKGS